MDGTFAYDVNSNQWKIGPPKPTATNNLGNLTAIVDNDSLYMVSIGGYGSGTDTANGKDANEWLNLGPYVISGIKNVPSHLSLSCYPNPFEKFTSIKFSLAQNSRVQAIIVDVLGNQIEQLCDKNMNAGNHQLKWNAQNYSNGVYFCKLLVNDNLLVQKLLKE